MATDCVRLLGTLLRGGVARGEPLVRAGLDAALQLAARCRCGQWQPVETSGGWWKWHWQSLQEQHAPAIEAALWALTEMYDGAYGLSADYASLRGIACHVAQTCRADNCSLSENSSLQQATRVLNMLGVWNSM